MADTMLDALFRSLTRGVAIALWGDKDCRLGSSACCSTLLNIAGLRCESRRGNYGTSLTRVLHGVSDV